MTDYEIAMLFFEAASLAINSIMFNISIVAGFLAAGLLFGPHMDRRLTTLLIGLYSFFFLIISFATSRQLASYMNLGKEIKNRTAEGGDLLWHGANAAPDAFLSTMPTAFLILFLIAYLGSLAFFFHTRKIEPRK